MRDFAIYRAKQDALNDAFDTGNFELAQQILQENQERADQFNENFRQLSEKLNQFVESVPNMSRQDWRESGFDVGEFTGRETAQIYAAAKISNGISKASRAVANNMKKGNALAKGRIIASHLQQAPQEGAKPLSRIARTEQVAKQTARTATDSEILGMYSSEASSSIPKAGSARQKATAKAATTPQEVTQGAKTARGATQPSSSNAAPSDSSLRIVPTVQLESASQPHAMANETCGPPTENTPVDLASTDGTKNTQQAKTNQIDNAAQKSKSRAKPDAESSGKYTPARKETSTNTPNVKDKPTAVKEFEKKYARYRIRYNTIAETNEKVRIPFPKSDLKKPEWAEDAYAAIRARSDDVAKIAKNTGMSETKISRIKHHLFHDDTHILSMEERIGRFSSDHEIAAAWDRLITGDYITNDICLLEHEFFESRFEKLFKTDYDTAHEKTQHISKGRPWFYPKYKE